MENDEMMKMLFDEHHRHLSEIKQKVQGLAQRTITLLALATGWLILAKNSPPPNLKFVLIITFILIGVSSIYALHRFNKNYRVEARIIVKINEYFKFFDEGLFIESDSVYPQSWKNFGNESVWYGLSHHIIAIVVMTALSVVTTYIR